MLQLISDRTRILTMVLRHKGNTMETQGTNPHINSAWGLIASLEQEGFSEESIGISMSLELPRSDKFLGKRCQRKNVVSFQRTEGDVLWFTTGSLDRGVII